MKQIHLSTQTNQMFALQFINPSAERLFSFFIYPRQILQILKTPMFIPNNRIMRVTIRSKINKHIKCNRTVFHICRHSSSLARSSLVTISLIVIILFLENTIFEQCESQCRRRLVTLCIQHKRAYLYNVIDERVYVWNRVAARYVFETHLSVIRYSRGCVYFACNV